MKRIAQSYHHKPKHLLPLVSYIAKRNENELIDFLEKKKVNTGVDTKDVIDATAFYVAKEQRKGNFRKAIKELYNLHPDKEAILELFSKQNSFEGKEVSVKEEKNEKTNFFKTPLFRLLVVVIVIFVLIVIVSKIGD
ncbi:hypothetical protein [Raineya sp.]|jgi:hypothetical protein